MGESEKNSGTLTKWTLVAPGPARAITSPSGVEVVPERGDPGARASSSGTVSLKSELRAPKVRLPLELTKTLVQFWPWKRNAKPGAARVEVSSPAGEHGAAVVLT